MRKPLLFKLFALVMCLSCNLGASAHDFVEDGIYYNVYGTQATVTFRGEYYYSYTNEYSGSVTIPESVSHNGTVYVVKNIGRSAFNECSGLTNVTIPNSVTFIDECAFSNCTSLKNVIIPNSVVEIWAEAFCGCTSLSSVKIPNSVKTIASGTFSECSSLTSVTIPNSVEYLGAGAFSRCTGLTNVTIGSSVEYIDEYIFGGCSNLSTLNVLATTPPAIEDNDAFDQVHYSSIYLKVPKGRKTAYQSANVWSNFTNISELLSLNDALNVEGGTIQFETSGDYTWITKSDGGRSYAQSDNAGAHSSTSALTATVTVNKASTLSFDFKAWGEGSNYDKCIFSIDGSQQFSYGARQNDWETYTVDIPAGTHTLTWTYSKDSSVNPTGDYFAIDNVALRRSLDPALNVTGGTIHFTSEGNYPWIVMESGGRDYAQSSNAGVASSSSVMTATVTVNKASTLSFDFKAWGEGTSYDKCIFSIDGEQKFSYGARQNDWETYSVNLSVGTHTLTWTYSKDSSVNPAGDYFAVDNVKLIQATIAHGDADGDGKIDMDDLTALINYLLTSNASYVNMIGADVNGSGGVGMDDLSALINYLMLNN